jgi:hypothetical protein
MARQHDSPRCTSAGRLTARLLLSFLTFSSIAVASEKRSIASQNTEALFPLPGLGPVYSAPVERLPQDAVHEFVRLPYPAAHYE